MIWQLHPPKLIYNVAATFALSASALLWPIDPPIRIKKCPRCTPNDDWIYETVAGYFTTHQRSRLRRDSSVAVSRNQRRDNVVSQTIVLLKEHSYKTPTLSMYASRNNTHTKSMLFCRWLSLLGVKCIDTATNAATSYKREENNCTIEGYPTSR